VPAVTVDGRGAKGRLAARDDRVVANIPPGMGETAGFTMSAMEMGQNDELGATPPVA